jgi:hypothetical protein
MSAKAKTSKRKCVSKKSATEKGIHKKVLLCPICNRPATKFIDGEPSCEDHVEQVYEHQVEDYTISHLVDNEWRKN